MNLQDLAALTVILSALGGVCFWIGSRTFATRKELHQVHSRLAVIERTLVAIQTDLAWIKKQMGGPAETPLPDS